MLSYSFLRSPQFCGLVVTRFDRTLANTIKFDDFIQVSVMLKSLTDAFRRKDTTQNGNITVHYEDVSMAANLE